MPLLSRVSDNNGLIFASSSYSYEFYIELWGQGFPDREFTSSENGTSTGTITVNNGAGGYTKLLMTVPFSHTLQIRPKYYLGGSNITSDSTSGTVTTSANIGGDSAGFGIDGEWMAVVGGGGLGGYRVTTNFSTISINGNTPWSYVTYSSPRPGGNGTGGYNILNPSAAPEVGGDSSTLISGYFSSTPGVGAVGFFNTAYSGAGGAGALPGTGGSGGVGGKGGEANIKIWAEQQILDGNLISFPEVKMKYIDSQDGINESLPRVRLTNKSNGYYIDYTQNQDIKVSDLPSILN